jgi:hypothetical protein
MAPQRPPRWTLRALQHLDVVDAPVCTLSRCERSADAVRSSLSSAT